MPQKTNREYRAFAIDIAQGEEKTVQGYASTFGEAYTLYDDDEYELREIMSAEAFDACDMSDVILQYNHEGRVFARVSNGTLVVRPDERGLYTKADLGGTGIGAELYEEIRGGYTDKMSIGFVVDKARDEWTRETSGAKTIETRTIHAVKKLYDVSAVSIPANPSTSIESVSVRTLVEGAIDKLKAERLELQARELERKRAEVKAKLLTGGTNGH